MNFNSCLHYFFIILYNPANAAILNKPFIQINMLEVQPILLKKNVCLLRKIVHMTHQCRKLL